MTRNGRKILHQVTSTGRQVHRCGLGEKSSRRFLRWLPQSQYTVHSIIIRSIHLPWHVQKPIVLLIEGKKKRPKGRLIALDRSEDRTTNKRTWRKVDTGGLIEPGVQSICTCQLATVPNRIVNRSWNLSIILRKTFVGTVFVSSRGSRHVCGYHVSTICPQYKQ